MTNSKRPEAEDEIPPELAQELLRALLVGEGSVIARLLDAAARFAVAQPQAEPALPANRPMVHTVSTLAVAVGMSRQYVLNDIRDGHLAARRPTGGRKWTIPVAEAERYAAWVAAGRARED